MVKQAMKADSGWSRAVMLCECFQRRPEKADALLNRICEHLSTEERKRCQSLFFGVLRNRRLIGEALAPWLQKKCRPLFRAACEVAAFDMLESPAEKRPKIIHFAVNWAKSGLSVPESGALNAILRKTGDHLQDLRQSAPPAVRLSHPDWLARRWVNQFGEQEAGDLMAWNQTPPPVYARWRGPGDPPAFLQPTAWAGFFKVPGGSWASFKGHLRKGRAFVQDPSTRLAPELLGVKPGERVLDLCAAPGGKSLLLADALGDDPAGTLVCVDKPGDRAALLDENLGKLNTGGGPGLELVQGDILDIEAEALGLFDAVLPDAPCSNTGVLRRRPDLRWRLRPDTLRESAATQLKLLKKTARWVRPGGRMVYSTCSIEPEENQEVVADFLKTHPGFTCVENVLSLPRESGHDGAAAHLLVRTQD